MFSNQFVIQNSVLLEFIGSANVIQTTLNYCVLGLSNLTSNLFTQRTRNLIAQFPGSDKHRLENPDNHQRLKANIIRVISEHKENFFYLIKIVERRRITVFSFLFYPLR